MANQISSPNDVTNAADVLMKSLLDYASASNEIDIRLSIMQTAAKWVAVRNKLSTVDEDNAFDGWRSSITAGTGIAAPAAAVAGSKRAGSAGTVTATAATNGSAPPAKRGRSTPRNGILRE